jgi:hypothetical protein
MLGIDDGLDEIREPALLQGALDVRHELVGYRAVEQPVVE